MDPPHFGGGEGGNCGIGMDPVVFAIARLLADTDLYRGWHSPCADHMDKVSFVKQHFDAGLAARAA